MNKKDFLVLFLILFILIVPNVSSQSEAFGVYHESDLKNYASSVTWGSIEVGKSESKQLYIVNFDKDILTSVVYSVSNFEPKEAEQYLTLTGSSIVNLNEGEGCYVPLVLSVDPSTKNITNFSFDITLTSGFTDPSTYTALDSSEGGNTWGGAGNREIDREETVVIPSNKPVISDLQKIVLLVVLGFCVYLLLGGSRR